MTAWIGPPRGPKGKDYLDNDRLLQNLHNYLGGLHRTKWKYWYELEYYIY